MMHFDTNVWSSSDNEKRELRVAVATLKRSLNIQKEKNKKLEDEFKRLKREYIESGKVNEKLKDQEININHFFLSRSYAGCK